MRRQPRDSQARVALVGPEDFGIGQLFERVPDGIVVRDVDSSRIVLWNPAAETIFGYTAAEILGRDLKQVIPGGMPSVKPRAGFVEVPAVRRDGQPLVIEMSTSAIHHATAPGDWELAIIRDVTTRAHAEAILRERSELLDLSHDAIFIVDPALRITYWSHGAETMYGWTSDKALGRVAYELLHTHFPVPLEEIQAEMARHGCWEGEVVHRRRDGALVSVAGRWLRRIDESGTAVSIMVTNSDITARKRFETALKESEARFQAFMDAGPVIAFIRDDEGRYIYTNRPHQQLFGSQHWAGTTVFEHFPEPAAAAILASDRHVLETGQPGQFEEEFLRDDGKLHLLAFKFPFLDLAGRRLVGSASVDITPLKQAQDALARANTELLAADRYKDEFLAILSHELRTPLNFIISYASVLEEGVGGPLNPTEQGYVTKVLLGADRLLSLIDNLLEMSRIAADRFKLVRALTAYAPLVEQVFAMLAPVAAEKSISLAQDLAVPGEVWLDGERIKHVLLNLVDNAIKFTPPGGKVSVRAFVKGDRLVTEIVDTGVGIAAEDIPKLFTRFRQLDMTSTREAGGMGLGLSLSQAIVRSHGGTIGVVSQPGHGSTFRFELPLDAPMDEEERSLE